MSIEMIVTVTADRSGQLIAPMGLSSGAATCQGVEVEGATVTRRTDTALSQEVMILTPEAGQVTLRYAFDPIPAPEPEAMFAPHDSRFTRCHPDLATEARSIVAAGGVSAMVAHVTSLFDYGHTNDRFYDDADAMPQLCDLTTGSCVDINAYLVASLRAAGVEVGYLTGYFIPEERRDHTTDMHCWVVTRQDGRVQYWDIAHHLKMGRQDIAPGLNPKPGVRVAMAHSMGWTVPGVPFADFKLVAEPMWFDASGWDQADCTFRLTGYDALDAAQNATVHA